MMIMRFFVWFSCLYKEVDKKYTGCSLKITELLDCALIGVCVVIRSNTVYFHGYSCEFYLIAALVFCNVPAVNWIKQGL